MGILDTIGSPADLKKLNMGELAEVSEEARARIIEVLKCNGGHLASNLGAVELTLAIHYVFDAPKDKIIFDVGHQSYTHKLVTGRGEAFPTIRTLGGLSGFPKRSESRYDAFDTGHSSTSISAGLGMARARDLAGEDYSVVSVIGDGAIGSGMAFEALNDLGQSKTRMIIVLNDNEMSISKNVGALSEQLSRMRVSQRYLRFKNRFSRFLKKIPLVGGEMERFAKRFKNAVKRLLVKGLLFEQMGLTYLGPIDGHNLQDMIEILSEARRAEDPVLLHVVTQKGRGYHAAEREPQHYHGVGGNLSVGTDADTFSVAAGKELTRLAETDEKIVAITAAMAEGTGLVPFSERFPKRFYDVGISEQHAVTLAAGLAAGGVKPFVCIYSTFLQRAYDQILHDVCLQDLPVTFLIDRAGISGRDGETHHGIFDIAYLRPLPNIEIYAPASEGELYGAMEYSLTCPHPVVIRYPHGKCEETGAKFSKGWIKLSDSKLPITVLACGSRMVKVGKRAAELAEDKGTAVNLVSCTAVKPLDTEFLDSVSGHSLVVLEDGILDGGLGSAVLEYYADCKKSVSVKRFGFAVPPVHGSVQELFELAGITSAKVSEYLLSL